jgi:hypothetical protein
MLRATPQFLPRYPARVLAAMNRWGTVFVAFQPAPARAVPHVCWTPTCAPRPRSSYLMGDRRKIRALLDAQWKDVLLVPQAWYPEHLPKYEAKGWWYVPAEEVLGRTCKAFCELTDFIGAKRRRTGSVNCLKSKPPGGRTGTYSKRGNTKAAPRRRTALTPEDSASDGSALRCSQRAKGPKSANYHEESESGSQSDSDEDRRDKELLYGVKMRAADPRYITHGDDGNRGDILLTMAQVKELITAKLHSEEEVATV